MEQALVSLIIPVYNVERYLCRCMDSVLAQTYKNLEILLINDGSTDGSVKICQEYAQNDSRIRLIHQENMGLSGARNTGIEASTGEYLQFLDSDDELAPTIIEELYTNLIETDADISVCSCKLLSENDIFTPVSDTPTNKGEREILEGKDVLAFLDRRGVDPMTQWNKLFKRFIFDELRFPLGRYHEDEFVIHRELIQAKRIVYLHKELYAYYQRSGSITKNNAILARRYRDVVDAFIDRVEFFDACGELEALASAYYKCCYHIQAVIDELPQKDIAYCYKKLYEMRRRFSYLDDGLSLKSRIKLWMLAHVPRLFKVLKRIKWLLSRCFWLKLWLKVFKAKWMAAKYTRSNK